MRLNPLSTGKSVQTKESGYSAACECLNPLSTGKSVQTVALYRLNDANTVLIPYLQGSLFRPCAIETSYSNCCVLIPYLQGSLFRPLKIIKFMLNNSS